MKKLILPIFLLTALAGSLIAQKPKGLPRKTATGTPIKNIKTPAKLFENGAPEISPVFQKTRTITSLPALTKAAQTLPSGFKVLSSDNNGLPTMIGGTLAITQSRELPLATRTTHYLDALKSAMEIKNPREEFDVKKIETDELGQSHVRMQQKIGNVPVWGSEIIVHERNGRLELMNGNYFPTPSVKSLEPSILKDAAETNVQADLNTKNHF